MDDKQKEIKQLKRMVTAAQQEIEMAIMFHETWRPAAYDSDLHERVGTSYAAHSFQIIRLALRRESLLALTRLWDSNKAAVRMSLILHRLRDKAFFEALVQVTARRMGLRSMFAPDAVKRSMEPKRDQVIKLIGKYSEGGTHSGVLDNLIILRHQRLAHRQCPNEPVSAAESGEVAQEFECSPMWPTDVEIEEFYQDNLEIMRILMSLVNGLAYDLSEATKVYKHHAKYFWASARGERTEGHPNYRPPRVK
ncbi:hypothetical protein [Pseudomonas sp. B26(2017)]|uniref:AbiU2 domain-containing protein n=1 Tax=Pseudomonas sp. B26(2017) TaxID=1981732 RepID=UPI000A1F6F02|nr:hypothetical protein [Pseudomonas sp. B26(2017)]